MANTRSMTRALIFILFAGLCMVSGCNKIAREDRSKITITGNVTEGIDLNTTYEVSEGLYEGPYGTGCEIYGYETMILFNMQYGASLWLRLIIDSDYYPVPEGNYYAADADCEAGVIAYLKVTTLKKAVYNLSFSSGTMKVKDDDGTLDITFDFTISPASGGGKFTGNFTGIIGSADL